jgi:hypothetical protein
MQIYKNRNSKGVTIVELIVYIGLLSIFMLVLLDVFVAILNSKLEGESTSSLNQDARYIYSKMAYDVANASSFTIPSGTQLSLNSGASIYSLSGGNLLLNSLKLNGQDTKINSISFTKVGNTVKVLYTIESLIELQSGTQTRTISTTFGIRP